jgi:aminoglycoside 3-N-acetyltransferase
MITSADITAALHDLGVAPADTLFVHSDVRRCLRVAGSSRKQKLDTIIQGLADAVPDGTLIMPTFSYSLCRREIFDIARTPSTVGVLTEYFRRQPDVRRTADPIFSTAVLGPVPAAWEADLFDVGDKDCFGERSVFAYLREVDAVQVCLGTAACTFVHHVEQREQVPYRYFKDFRGVVAKGKAVSLVTARYFVRPLEEAFNANLYPLLDRLEERGLGRSTLLDRGPTLSAARSSAVEATAIEAMRENPDFLIQRGHPDLPVATASSRSGNPLTAEPSRSTAEASRPSVLVEAHPN